MDVFITGGTGYIGRRLAETLVARGHRVRVLTRPGSRSRVTTGAEAVVGSALDATSYVAALRAGDTLVHLVGTPHPSPAKAAEFQRVDPPSIEAAVEAGRQAQIAHLIYVSVAHPAPVMKAFIEGAHGGGARDRERRADRNALVLAVEHPPAQGQVRIMSVPDIKRSQPLPR